MLWLIMDQAGWHMTTRLIIPEKYQHHPAAGKSPESHPVENIWQFMRDNWLSNRNLRNLRRESLIICVMPGTSLISQPGHNHFHRRRQWAQEF